MQLPLLMSHERQVELQAVHVVPTLGGRNCFAGHKSVHVPAVASKVAPTIHEVQPVAVPSEHVAHEEWHISHVLFTRYLPDVGQLETHEPSS